MDYYKVVQQWLSTKGSYNEGVELYRVLGEDLYLKNKLFARVENSFIYEKLWKELDGVLKKLSPAMEAPVMVDEVVKVETKGKEHRYKGLSVDDFFDLPKELQRERLEIGGLYKEAVELRRRLKRELNLPMYKGSVTLQEGYGLMSQLTKDGKPVPFDLMWVTYNEDTGEGGEVREYRCVLVFSNKTGSKFKAISVGESDRRDPRHGIHGTMNVQIVNTREVRKLHTWLIVRVNGYDVVI